MNERTQRAVESFIMNFTGANATEIQEYVAEIRLNQDFHNHTKENRSVFGRG